LNKRLIKKMLKKKEQFDGFVYAEGNNGADYIKIKNAGDGLIDLDTGHCCVVSIQAVVPTEFLTALIANKLMGHNWDINSVIDSFEWDKEHTDQLKAKVKNYNF